MFPDIALQGTAAPETVPSFSVRTTTGFEEAFAGLLNRSVRLQADPSQLPAPALPVPWLAEDASVAPETWRAIANPADVLPFDAPLSEPVTDVTDTAPAAADEITPKPEPEEEGEPAPIIVAAPALALQPPELPRAVVEMPSLTPSPIEVPSSNDVHVDLSVTPGDDIVRHETQQEPVETLDATSIPVVETPSIEEAALHPGHPFRGAAASPLVEADLQVGLIEQQRGLDRTRGRVHEDAPVPVAQRHPSPDLPAALTAPAFGRPEEVRARLASLLATLPQVPAPVTNTLPEVVAEAGREGEEALGHLRQGPPEGGYYVAPIGRLEAGRARLASILATLLQMSPNASVPRQPEQISQVFEKSTLPELVAGARDQVASSETRADLKVGPYSTAGSTLRDIFESGRHQEQDASQTLARELMSLAGRVAPHEPQILAALAPATGSDAPEANGLQFSAVPVRPLTPVLLNVIPRLPEVMPRPTLPAEAETARSIVQTLRMQAASGGGIATLTLRPEYLGAVTVSLQVKEGGVVATMQAENSAVRSWIESNVQILRDGLAEQGLKLEQVIVSERQTPDLPEDSRRDRQAGEQTPPRRMRRREDSKFEVLA